jgi:hypothetical protein
MFLLLQAAAAMTVQGDFDRDGRKDIARALPVDGGYRIVVDRGGDPKRRVVVEPGPFRDPFLEASKMKGEQPTACGKGMGDGSAPCTPTVRLRGGELMFGEREASAAVAVWDGRAFRTAWVSD